MVKAKRKRDAHDQRVKSHLLNEKLVSFLLLSTIHSAQLSFSPALVYSISCTGGMVGFTASFTVKV